jgi:hypothetical protein
MWYTDLERFWRIRFRLRVIEGNVRAGRLRRMHCMSVTEMRWSRVLGGRNYNCADELDKFFFFFWL